MGTCGLPLSTAEAQWGFEPGTIEISVDGTATDLIDGSTLLIKSNMEYVFPMALK